MSWSEYTGLLAERGTLQRLLADIPDEDVITRGSFLSRLEEVEERIAEASAVARKPARARLTFRGRPVVGGHGIYAEFGLKATSDFVEVVTAMAASRTVPLGSSGPIPNRDQYQLLITSTAIGSFGFEFEEHIQSDREQISMGLDVETAVGQALAQCQELFRGILGTDDELADAITGIDRRARNAVRTFLGTLAANNASHTLGVGDTTVTFPDVGAVRRGLQRLEEDNLHEEPQSFEGEFQSVLPKRRTFEFRHVVSDEVLTGKLGPGIGDPDALNVHLHQPARIQVTSVRVGNGRPRFVLDQQPEWLERAALPGADIT